MKLSQLIATDQDVEITGIETDSRKVKKGNLFLCLVGEKTDGHKYAGEALGNGASVILCERPLGFANEILVPDTRKLAATLFSTWYQRPQDKLDVYGVTGTNGKTSVVNLLNAIYRRAGYQTAMSGTVGSFWQDKAYEAENTTAMPSVLYKLMREMVDDGVEKLFIEVSSHALSLDRVSEIEFHSSVYNNLTPEHMDFHKTMASYAKAKAKLFDMSRMGFFNYDDKYSYIASQCSSCKAFGFGKNSDADFIIDSIEKLDVSGCCFTVKYKDRKYPFASKLVGEFNVYNLLAAISVAFSDGIEYETVRDAVASFTGVKGRMERIYHGSFSVFIDYAHTPDALYRVLSTLRQTELKRLRILFGCGGDRDKTKRPIMGGIAERLADEVIVTSDNARSENPSLIIEDILAGIKHKNAYSIKVIENRRMALEYAIDSSLPGDVLLVAGKGHEEYEIDCSGRHSFSEREILLARLRTNGYSM